MPRSPRLLKIGLLAFSIVFSVLCLELIMRVYIFGASGLSYEKMKSVHSIGRSGLIRASEHREILYELLPDLDTTYKLHPFSTNSRGLRDREYPDGKGLRTFRVAVLGDSLTLGSGISIEEAYHSLLEERLNEESPDVEYEFLNFGVSGYFLTQYLAVIRHRLPDYDPDLILIGFYAGNDVRVPPREKFEKPYRVQGVENGFLELHSFSLLGDIWKYGILGKTRGPRSEDERRRVHEEQMAFVGETFGAIREAADGIGAPVFVAYLDNKPGNPGPIEELARARGFGFVDTTHRFEGTSINDFSIYLTDKHPNGEANAIFAEEIHGALTRGVLAEPFPAVVEDVR